VLGRVRDLSATNGGARGGLRKIPSQVSTILNAEEEIARSRTALAEADHITSAGRGGRWPGKRDRKLKEIS